MIATVLTVLLALGGQSSEPAASGTPMGNDPPKTALQTAQDTYLRTQQLYTESCSDRAYGAYDDLCSQLAEQVHQSRVDLDRLERADDERRRRRPAPQ